MKKLLLIPLIVVLLAPIYALPFMTVNAPSQAYVDQQFTISVVVDDSQGGLQSIQFYREGILRTTHICNDADDTEYRCTFDWQTLEQNIGKVSYKVEARSDYGGSDATAEKEFTIDIIATPPADLFPTAVASANPISGRAPLTVDFQGSANGGEAPITYSWDFGDGQTSILQNPTHTYRRTGTYTATLTVMDADGDSDTAQVTITVRSQVYVKSSSGGSSRRSFYSGGVPTIDTPKEKSTSSMIRKTAGELELSENFIEVESGETHKVQLTIKNTGSKVTQYNLNIVGLESMASYEIEPVLVTMSPNQELTIYAYLNINNGAEGQYVATISLISDSTILDGEALIVNVQEQQIPYTIILFGAVLILVALITATAFAFRE